MTTEELTKIKKPRLTVTHLTTQEIVHAVPLSSTKPRWVERILSDLTRNIDTSTYFVAEDF